MTYGYTYTLCCDYFVANVIMSIFCSACSGWANPRPQIQGLLYSLFLIFIALSIFKLLKES
ncbi:hypothetical protein D0Y65_025753 [Glycine soja]|uniref:Uncharacterized protein n=1 Tax=Glycine soja TaxID=3848 RepID=A0A445IGL6_GLYSO|nr:hypothetical protein D0Y65_025753 [Glycine soja]